MERNDHILAEAILRVAVIEDHERELAMLDHVSQYPPFSTAHEKRMRKLFRLERFYRNTKTTASVFHRLVATILMIVAITSLLLLFSEEVRAVIPNVVIEWFDRFVDFRFGKSEAEVIAREWELTYIPEGYKLISDEYEAGETNYLYQSSLGKMILFDAYPLGIRSLSTDNEHYDYQRKVIKGIEYHIMNPLSEGYPYIILWVYEDYDFMLTVDEGIDLALSLAKSVSPK
jgi:hypothetical protein